MQLLTGITSNSFQPLTVTLDTGDVVNLTLLYYPTQNGWFINVKWKNFEVRGVAVVSSLNILRPWKNVIPFGIGVAGTALADPYGKNAFASGTSSLFILNASDVDIAEADYFLQ